MDLKLCSVSIYCAAREALPRKLVFIGERLVFLFESTRAYVILDARSSAT